MSKKKKKKKVEPIKDVNEFTEKEIGEFLKECGKKPQFSIEQFNEALAKNPDELTYRDNRILINKAGWLSDDERKKFKKVLAFENLTPEEEERYKKIYPNTIRFDALFPKTK